MGSLGYVVFFATIFVLSSLRIEADNIPCSKEINQVCQSSGLTDIASCEATVGTYPGISKAKDVKSIADIALHVTSQESVRTSDFLIDLAGQSTTNPAYKGPLNGCSKYFGDTLMNLNLHGLPGGTASLDVHYALDSVEYCENTLLQNKVSLPVVADMIQKWKTSFNIAYGAVMIAENQSGGGI